MTQIVDECRTCGSLEVEWREATKHSLAYLHCRRCFAQNRADFSASTWIMLSMALVAAVWGWVVVFN